MSMLISYEAQRTGHVATVYDGSLFLWGGYKEAENEFNEKYIHGSEVVQYSTLFEKWFYRISKGNVPPGTSGASSVQVGCKLYCFGGYRKDGNTNDLLCLNLRTFIWHFIAPDGPPPILCDKAVGWEHNNRLFFFGGFGLPPDPSFQRPRDFSYVVDIQTPQECRRGWNNQLVCFDITEEKWSNPAYKGKAPVARAAHACAKVKNKVFIFGGRHLGTRMNDLHCFDNDAMQWTGELETFGAQPVNRSWHSLTALTEERLLLYGGFSQDNVPLSDGWILFLPTMTWMQLDLPPDRPRLWHTATMVTSGEVFICGGCCQNILNHQPVHDHEVELIVLRFTPKTLLRLCLDTIIDYYPLLQAHWKILPTSVCQILYNRVSDGCQPEIPPLSGS